MAINCSLCPHKTNPNAGFCCGIIPFPLKFLESHKPQFKASGELKDDGNQAIILTKDFLCVFFDRLNHSCSIYNERPQICRSFGMIKELPCVHFKRSGARRSLASQKVTLRKVNASVDRVFNNGKNMFKSKV